MYRFAVAKDPDSVYCRQTLAMAILRGNGKADVCGQRSLLSGNGFDIGGRGRTADTAYAAHLYLIYRQEAAMSLRLRVEPYVI